MCPPLSTLAVNPEGKLVCHVLLVETERGLVLVDTGLGTADVEQPAARLGRGFLVFAGPRLDPSETALHQIEALGYQRSDVRHLIVTHLDLDHAGGLADFPEARVHVYKPEHDAALSRATLLERERYRPAHFRHEPRFQTYDLATGGERFLGFECVRELVELPPEILLVPLVGHTRGHCAVAVRAGDGWLLHCGDAYFYRDELRPEAPYCTPGLATFQRMVAVDDQARRHNQERLRELKRAHGSEVRIFSAHDPAEFAACLGGAS